MTTLDEIAEAHERGEHERVLRLTFKSGSTAISSHGFEGLAVYRDQGAVFGGFVRACLDDAHHRDR